MPHRPDPTDWLAGRNAVAEALSAARPVHKVLLARGSRGLSSIVAAAKQANVPVQSVARSRLDAITGSVVHQGVVALVAPVAYADLEETLARAAADTTQPPLLVLLNEVQDPHNLGSILRTADAVGAHGVLVGKHRAVGLTPAVARASAGAVEHVPVVRVTNLARTLADLKEHGYWVVGTDAGGDHVFRTIDYAMPLVVVIGGEDRGLGQVVAKRCDWIVRLPSRGAVNSLNASVAAAIVLYHAFTCRAPVK